RPQEEREGGRVGIALGGQPGEGFHHAGPLPETLEIVPEPAERVANVEVVQPEQLTTLALEPDGVAPGEQLESTAEARAGAARAPSHGGQPPEVAGEEADQPVVLAQIPGAKHDSLGAEQRHGWRRGSGGQPVAQLAQRVVVTPPVLPDL